MEIAFNRTMLSPFVHIFADMAMLLPLEIWWMKRLWSNSQNSEIRAVKYQSDVWKQSLICDH